MSTAPACSTRSRQLGWVAEVGGGEAGLTAFAGDGADHCRAPGGVASVHDYLGAVPGEFCGRRLADARGRAGDQSAQAVKISLFVHVASFQPNTSTMDIALGPPRYPPRDPHIADKSAVMRPIPLVAVLRGRWGHDSIRPVRELAQEKSATADGGQIAKEGLPLCPA
jgi:hypothetical protein